MEKSMLDESAQDVDSKPQGITLEEVKQYLRVDFDDDDQLIKVLVASSDRICRNILRCSKSKDLSREPQFKIAMLFSIGFLYENREKADHQSLNATLRALLFGIRKEVF